MKAIFHIGSQRVSIAPLISLRISLGIVMFWTVFRFYEKGWIRELYVDPTYHFSFVSWIKPLSELGMQIVFAMLIISSLGVLFGFFYRLSTSSFFLLFSYVELLDKAYYLNHYYLLSLLSFWLIFVPAHRRYSIDSWLRPSSKAFYCPQWCILIFKIQISIVYFFAGFAKLNGDWLFRAQPLSTWLPGKYQIPVLGSWLHLKETAFLFSWVGCIYDLFIWMFLWIRKTRSMAFLFVIIFHLLTGILFPRIGMFPYIMIASTLIFFSEATHEKILRLLPFSRAANLEDPSPNESQDKLIIGIIILYLFVQILFPLRYLRHDGHVFWHERSYRFSWRVMLMEKNGATAIILKDPLRRTEKEIDQDDYLTPFQKQQMRSQPDMIHQFVHYIGDTFYKDHKYKPQIYVKSRISLNARRSSMLTNETVDVYALNCPYEKDWITQFRE